MNKNYSFDRINTSSNCGFLSEETVLTGSGVSLRKKAACGEYISRAINSKTIFMEAIPSWVIHCPEGASYEVQVSFSDDFQNYSPWINAGSWNRKGVDNETGCDYICLNIDHFIAKKQLKSCKFKVKMFGGRNSPTIKSLSMAFAGSIFQPKKTGPQTSTGINRELEVPFRSQYWENPKISGDICSPTSVSMVMDYWGVKRPTAEIAGMTYDCDTNLYGMWWRATAAAAQHGFDAWVQYFATMEEAENKIAQNIPVIACICYEKNTLKKAPASFSHGHVLVISGFDKNGNPICRDSAGTDREDGIVNYDRGEFSQAWLGNAGGIGYIIKPFES